MTKNPNRYFYTCPLGRDDVANCKFFKWADEVEAEREAASGAEAEAGAGSGSGSGGASGPRGGPTPAPALAVPPTTPKGNRLGGDVSWTPTSRRLGLGAAGTGAGIGEWFSPSKRSTAGKLAFGPAPLTPNKNKAQAGMASTAAAAAAGLCAPGPGTAAGSSAEDDIEIGIDWAAVDADSLEADAEARTPHASSSANTPAHTPAKPTHKAGTPASRLQDRLVAVAGKRKREDGEGEEDGERAREKEKGGAEPTPKKQSNPFIDTTPRPHTPSRPSTTAVPGSTHSNASAHSAYSTGSLLDDHQHPALVPVVASLEGLGQHLARQDRLVRAAEAMKKSMRQTIQNLQDRVRELERENAELRK